MDHRRDHFFPAPAGSVALPAANSQFAIIAPDLGLIFLFIALVACTPLPLGLWYGETGVLLPVASAPAGFGQLGFWLAGMPRAEGEARLSAALSAVARVWLAAALIGALPYTLGPGMPYGDSVFEAMSGWTGTGFSLLPSIETAPRAILFWRSLTRWAGSASSHSPSPSRADRA